MLMQFQDFDAPYLDRLRSGDRSTQEHFVAYFGKLVRLKLGKRLRSFAAIEDLQQAAVIEASFVYLTAMRTGMIPRKPMPKPEKFIFDDLLP